RRGAAAHHRDRRQPRRAAFHSRDRAHARVADLGPGLSAAALLRYIRRGNAPRRRRAAPEAAAEKGRKAVRSHVLQRARERSLFPGKPAEPHPRRVPPRRERIQRHEERADQRGAFRMNRSAALTGLLLSFSFWTASTAL